MRIGIIYERGGAWNGVAHSMAAGFRARGDEVVLIGAHLGRVANRLYSVYSRRVRPLQRGYWPVPQVQNIGAKAALRRAGAVDAWIQLGSTLPDLRPRRYLTFEDMTLPLALDDIEYETMSARARKSWLARQRRAYEGASRCFAASEWAANSIREDFGVPAAKVCVVGIGHSFEMAEPLERDWTRPTFLWVGTDWDRKNGQRVVDAFARVRRSEPSATLHLVGNHPVIEDEGVIGHGFLGRSDPVQTAELQALFETATCFVMPSRREPWGIVYVEAGAHGVASIGTTVGGAATAIGPGGFCINPSDDEALEVGMRRMCDPETAQRLGRIARAHSETFTWSNIVKKMSDEFDAPDG